MSGLITRLEDTRIIYINGEITDEMAFRFNMALLKMEQENSREDIVVYINSPGGDVFAGLSMIDTMNLISCDVATVCVGMAASMGAMILMSGEKGKRRILEHSQVLIHQPMGNFGNQNMQASDIEIVADNIKEMKKTLYDIIVEATGQKYKKVSCDCDRNYTLSAEKALEYHIVDEIIKKHEKKGA